MVDRCSSVYNTDETIGTVIFRNIIFLGAQRETVVRVLPQADGNRLATILHIQMVGEGRGDKMTLNILKNTK